MCYKFNQSWREFDWDARSMIELFATLGDFSNCDRDMQMDVELSYDQCKSSACGRLCNANAFQKGINRPVVLSSRCFCVFKQVLFWTVSINPVNG